MKGRQSLPLLPIKKILKPTSYVLALQEELRTWAFDEEEAPQQKGKWRSVFSSSQDPNTPLDLEIGTGNGLFFAHRAKNDPQRLLLGIERKFKPLVQTTRRFLRNHSHNARTIRYHARYLDHLFAEQELNHVFIHFPDPWPKKRQQKNRLLQTSFFQTLASLQKPHHFLEFKTDQKDYFESAIRSCPHELYEIQRMTWDLHHSLWAQENIQTQFEQYFLKNHQPIYYVRWRRLPLL